MTNCHAGVESAKGRILDATHEYEVRTICQGVNQAGVRDHNERLVLSLIQRNGGLPNAQIARQANLSAQTVSVIIRLLERDGLLLRGEPVRGKVGKPSIPMILNPDGFLSLGLDVGRRSASLVLIDALGKVRFDLRIAYSEPVPEVITQFARTGLDQICTGLTSDQAAAISGIGVAAPHELWHWTETAQGSDGDLSVWKSFGLQKAIEDATGYKVFVQNDTTSACTAEHLFGRGKEFADYAYFFVGAFVGGGVVLGNAVYVGRTGNAGAFGSLPIGNGAGGPSQLLHKASLYLLAQQLENAGRDASPLWDPKSDWAGFDDILALWIDETAKNLSAAIVSVCAVIDFECAMIECSGPPHVRRQLVEATRRYLNDRDTRGISEPVTVEATVGRSARAIGAATLPLISRYFLNQPGFV